MSLIVALIFVSLLFALIVVQSTPRLLVRRVKSQLDPDERVLFESAASRFKSGLTFLVGIHWGAIVVTDKRLLFGVWILPPVWRLSEDVRLDEIQELDVSGEVPTGVVKLRLGDRRLWLTPTSGFIRFPNYQRSMLLAEAINRGRSVHA